jgi:hypothetical protein
MGQGCLPLRYGFYSGIPLALGNDQELVTASLTELIIEEE